MSLLNNIKALKNKNNDNFYPNDNSWVQYVKDHRSEILSSATYTEIDPNVSHECRYSINSYLTEINVPVSIGWIVLWINQLDSDMRFDGTISNLYMPSIDTISKLQREYITVSKMQQKQGVYIS